MCATQVAALVGESEYKWMEFTRLCGDDESIAFAHVSMVYICEFDMYRFEKEMIFEKMGLHQRRDRGLHKTDFLHALVYSK